MCAVVFVGPSTCPDSGTAYGRLLAAVFSSGRPTLIGSSFGDPLMTIRIAT